MSPENSGPAELRDAASPTAEGWPDNAAEPDPGWPDDDAGDERDPGWPDDWPDDGGQDPPWRRAAPSAPYGRGDGPGRPGRPRRSALRPLALAIVAVVALAAGAGVALAIIRGLDRSSSPSAAPGTRPPAVAPGGSGGTIPGGGAVGQMFVTGSVTAVSSTSVTIGGGSGRSVTAAITSSTRITGKVTSVAGIRVGDQVSAQITETNGGQPRVTAIQDPAQVPSGGGLP